jgi:hypothetical protein
VLPKVVFDTSGINALEDGGADSARLMRTLAWECEVLLTFINAEELISTPSPNERNALIGRFSRLLRPGRCIVPPGEIVRLMISAHVRAPDQFDWTRVDVMMPPAFEDAIIQRDCLDDAFCTEQGIEQRSTEKQFKQLLKSVRPELDKIPPQDRPDNYQEFAAICEGDNQFVWNFGRGIYETVSGEQLPEPEIRKFITGCPPFYALCLGQVMGFYGWSLRGQGRRNGGAPGRNDLMMAGYLPYCDRFITNDRPQREALREVVSRADIACKILSFEEFKQAVSEE